MCIYELNDEETLLFCSWTVKEPLPTPCCHANLVVVENKLYLIGGSNMSDTSSAVTSLSSVYCYNEEDDIWDKVTDIMIPRHDCGTAAIGKLYIGIPTLRSQHCG